MAHFYYILILLNYELSIYNIYISLLNLKQNCILFTVDMTCNQEAMSHLRWMLQKDILGQDMFLIGKPGPLRRRLALAYLELTNKSVEFVSLSQDTTEADLKQRREIIGGTAKYINQVNFFLSY